MHRAFALVTPLVLSTVVACQAPVAEQPHRAPAPVAPPAAPTALGVPVEERVTIPIESAKGPGDGEPADRSCDARLSCQGESCCKKLLVPGGSYRDEIAGSVAVEAFYLDKYELTVGRVRAWVKAGRPVPADGAVLGYDSGKRPVLWQKAFKVQSESKLKGWERYDTWQLDEDDLPKNFLDWYTAAAVCSFAGGRLPTDAEWRYAAVGGDEDRAFPWGAEEQTPERAVYNCLGDGDKSCSIHDILPVGSRPLGAGRWGHMDLAGSMFEWTLDAGGPGETVNRGGGFCYIGGMDRRAKHVRTKDNARHDAPSVVSHMVGARCAFDAPSDSPAVAAR